MRIGEIKREEVRSEVRFWAKKLEICRETREVIGKTNQDRRMRRRRCKGTRIRRRKEQGVGGEEGFKEKR